MSKAIRWTDEQFSAWNRWKSQVLGEAPKAPVHRVQKLSSSHGEDLLAAQMRSRSLSFIPQYKPIPGRKFAFDYFVAPDILVEVQGGAWSKGKSAHNGGTGLQRDCEKSSLAACLGFRTIHATTEQVESGQALKWILDARKARTEPERVVLLADQSLGTDDASTNGTHAVSQNSLIDP